MTSFNVVERLLPVLEEAGLVLSGPNDPVSISVLSAEPHRVFCIDCLQYRTVSSSSAIESLPCQGGDMPAPPVARRMSAATHSPTTHPNESQSGSGSPDSVSHVHPMPDTERLHRGTITIDRLVTWYDFHSVVVDARASLPATNVGVVDAFQFGARRTCDTSPFSTDYRFL
ncbi:hypothetical protein BV25DRAFT_1840418 [Artomyces pyxidatus]|uniref:Uncharacterized protein n=1 Tax=Artomyces pyxidatus TaxID=48021 RepID=A0ACB8STA6_9AGAM|nr:hypothetical protein BV25DRAFT_1840418 [Artomyces pyxidatus]